MGDNRGKLLLIPHNVPRWHHFGTKDFMIHFVGPVIGSHTGCGVVALFFVGKE